MVTPVMAAPSAGFQGLGHVSAEIDNQISRAYGISADGSTVVGGVADGGFFWTFRWTQAGGMSLLPKSNASEIYISQGHAVSADGSTVVGMEYNGTTNSTTGYRWSATGGLQVLPYQPGVVDNNFGTADAVSADGSVVAGSAPDAYQWTQGGGIGSISALPGNSMNHAHGISADGSVVVGASSHFGVDTAFRWTLEGGTEALVIPGSSSSDALGISGNGMTIVGTFTDTATSGQSAFVWTSTSVITLTSLSMDSGVVTAAYAVSEDSAIAVGVSDNRAALWDTATGEVWDLNALVAGLPEFAGWELEDATGISANGLKIVGNGTNPDGNPEAWIIDLSAIPEPSFCLLGIMATALAGVRRRR